MSNVALQPVPRADNRGAARFRLRFDTAGEAPDGGLLPVTVHDVSTTGLLFASKVELPVGATVTVELAEAGPVEAEILWSSGRYSGAQFARPISEDAVQSVWNASRVVWPEFPASAAPAAPVAQLQAAAAAAFEFPGGDNPLPVARRIQAILAISAALWIGIALTAAALVA